MIGDVISGFFNMVWSILQIPVYIVLAITTAVMLIYFWHSFYWKVIKGCRTSGTEHYAVKKENIFQVIWYGLKQAAYDKATRNIEYIPEGWTGLICFEGMPGVGKSTTAVWDTITRKTEYPKLKVYTNMDVTFQDGSIDTWKDLMSHDNGEYGQIYILDELSSLMNARSWKDFDVNALDLITQSRKIRTRICFTTQEFNMCDINLRRLCKEVWRPVTLFKTICFVLKFKPKVNSEGKVEKMKFKGLSYYRQDEKLRNCFDTRKQIGKLKREGFAPRESQIRLTEPNKTNIEVVSKKKR